MASAQEQEAASSSTTLPAFNPLPSSVPGYTDEDEDEWEYEYSNTETETYYLPVDFSISQFTRRNRVVSLAARGGHHSRNWTGLENIKKPEIKHHRLHSDDEDDDNNDPLHESDDEEGDDPTLGGVSKEADAAEDLEDDLNSHEPEELQILDLHSEHPIFHYRKRTFEGSWARILGTELLFAERAPPDDLAARTRPLPYIRSLPGDVDLLAASWSRISTKEVQLQRRAGAEANREDPLKDFKASRGISIPIWSDKTGERSNQTRFLEDLIALKMKKGEKDKVTVYAQAPEGVDRVSRNQRVRRGVNRRGRAALSRAGGLAGARHEDTPSLPLGQDDSAAEDSKKRRRPLPEARPTKLRRPYGTGPYARKTREVAALRAAAEEPDPYSESSTSTDEDADALGVVSVPTPERWADLEDETDSEDYDGEDDDGDADADGDTVMAAAAR